MYNPLTLISKRVFLIYFYHLRIFIGALCLVVYLWLRRLRSHLLTFRHVPCGKGYYENARKNTYHYKNGNSDNYRYHVI